VSRREEGAVLHDPDLVAARAVAMATEGRVETADGGEVTVEVRSLCVHGDTPGAVDLARAVRAALEKAGVALEAFA
jgi:5-oxoprolinase (ATP-hydrolysing) subunit A